MSAAPVEQAAALRDLAAGTAERSESDRRLAPELVAAIADADLFRLGVPRSVGGREATAHELVAAVEMLSEGDGAAGWCLMIAATSGLLGGWYAEDAAREVFGRADAPCGGVFAPRGRASAQDGGYSVTGQWAFSSGVPHSAWMLGGCVVYDGDQPRLLESGAPDVHVLAWPAESLEIVDTWSVTGLRGTGSHDMKLDGAAVPERRAVSLFTERPAADGPLYAFPIFGMLAVGVASVGLGIARSAIADLVALAEAKTPSLSRRSLAQHPAAQSAVATAEARLRSARAFLYEAIDEAWEEAERTRQISLERRAAVRMAATNAGLSAAEAVTAAFHTAGGSSIYTSSPLERRFRDVHTIRQHMIIGPSTWELAGRVLLGADVDASMM